MRLWLRDFVLTFAGGAATRPTAQPRPLTEAEAIQIAAETGRAVPFGDNPGPAPAGARTLTEQEAMALAAETGRPIPFGDNPGPFPARGGGGGGGGGLVIRPNEQGQMLRVKFDFEKTISGTPNKGKLMIYNLSAESRYQIKREFDRVRVEAGYIEAGNRGIIFDGFVREVRHARESADIVTTVTCGDGDKDIREGVVSTTLPAGTRPAQVIDELLKRMPDVDRGVIHERVAQLPPYTRPVVLFGPVRDELNKIGRTHGLYWSVQDGALEVIPGDGFIDDVTVISQRTGMIDVPDVTDNGIKVKTLLNPQIRVGRVIEVRSETLAMNDEQGRFRVSSVAFSGDTHANDWFSQIEAERIDGDKVDEG